MLVLLWIVLALVGLVALALVIRSEWTTRQYGPQIRRMFEEKPIFSPTEGAPHPDAEEVQFQTADGVTLRGSYLATPCGTPKGLVVFCHEYLSDRWSGVSYWEFLQRDGFDIFAFDFRNHGSSDSVAAYTPRHWVTDVELRDLEAALAYLKTRPGADKLPIGLYGISRGGGSAIGVAAHDHSVRCIVTDGAFATHGTVVTYMKKWIMLITNNSWVAPLLPDWYLGWVGNRVLRGVERENGCRFVRLERAIRRISPRPLLMIHGGRDSYIRPAIARQFFEHARAPREFWVVEGARHNACLETVGDEYRCRVRDFFRVHLSGEPALGAR